MARDRLLEVLRALAAGGVAGRADLLVVGSGSAPRVLAGVLRDAGLGSAAARRLRLVAAVDPRRLAFARFGAARGVVNTFSWGRERWWDNLAGLLAFPLECCLRGRVPGVNAGDPWQQSATVVLAATGAGVRDEELYALREQAPGFPALDRAALAAAVRRGLGEREEAAAPALVDGSSTAAAAGGAPPPPPPPTQTQQQLQQLRSAAAQKRRASAAGARTRA